jgi:hypothetical protein
MNEQQRREYYETINRQFHRLGRITTLLAVAALISFPFFIVRLYGVSIDWAGFVKGILNVGVIYYPVAAVEFLVFAPMVGVGGSYLSFLTGNLSNLKIPCAVNSRDIAGAESGTPEAEVISTISIATSALVTMLILFAGAMMIVPLTPVLEMRLLQPAFHNVVAALFGALGLKYFVKEPKIAVVPLALMTLLCVLVPSMIDQTSILIIPAGFLALAMGYLLFKKKKLGGT